MKVCPHCMTIKITGEEGNHLVLCFYNIKKMFKKPILHDIRNKVLEHELENRKNKQTYKNHSLDY